MTKAITLIATLTILGALSACSSDPIVGEWEDDVQDMTEVNELTIEDDYTGHALIRYWRDGQVPSYVEFDVEVTYADPDRGAYELELDCIGDCSEADTVMDCEISTAGDRMSCDAIDVFEEFEFKWDKVEDEEMDSADETEDDDYEAICSEGESQCGNGSGGSNNIYTCMDGDWVKVAECGFSTCVNAGDDAYCW